MSVAKYCKNNKIDAIQSLLFMDNQIARFSGLLAGVPIITSVRGEIGPLLGKWKTRFELKAQRLSDRIVVNSEWLKTYLVQLGSNPDKIIVIYNGTDYERYQNNDDRRKLKKKYAIPGQVNVITIVARLHVMKDHETFLRTVKVLKESSMAVMALIAGDGDERYRLESKATEMGLADCVRFLGNVSDNISEIYRITDVFVLTSQWGESFPNVILEAMAAGVPVVASCISAVPEIISDGENGFLVEKKNHSGFADKAARILEDEDLRQKLVENGRKTVKEFSVQKMVERYESLYQEMLQG